MRRPSSFRRMARRRELIEALTATILNRADLQIAFKEVVDEVSFVEQLRQEIEKYPRVLTTQ